jgi:hypothetical protein
MLRHSDTALLGLLYLLRRLLPRPAGTHAERRRNNCLRRDQEVAQIGAVSWSS